MYSILGRAVFETKLGKFGEELGEKLGEKGEKREKSGSNKVKLKTAAQANRERTTAQAEMETP